MKKVIGLALLYMIFGQYAYTQLSQQQRDSIRQLTEQDYKKMPALLNITSLRPGANGNDPNAPDAANYDESKANPFPDLPDPLLLKNQKNK